MKQIISLEDYLQEMKKYDDYKEVFYRGQSDSRYNEISCGIVRNYGFKENEDIIIAETLQNRKDDFKNLIFPVEQLAKMQHYGIPTRLIDVTTSSLIALYFAVENTNNTQDGEVFVFIRNSYTLNSKEVKLNSLLSNLKLYEVNNIRAEYETTYNENITEEEIYELAVKNVYVKSSDELKNSNERLFNQEGTFIVCGNKIDKRIITDEILDVKKEEADIIITIPFEYKQVIKDELEKQYNINESYIYPELSSFARYIRDKYTAVDLDLDSLYDTVKEEDVSHAAAKRKSITIVLNEKLPIKIIKKIVNKIIDDYNPLADVIWVYVAVNKEDLVMTNWIVRAMWIDSFLDKRWWPCAFGEIDENGVRWSKSKDFAELNKVYDTIAFDDDKNLFIYNQKSYMILKDIYEKVSPYFKAEQYGKFIELLIDNKKIIRDEYFKFGEYGHSRNIEFNKYLNRYQSFAAYFDNLIVCLSNNTDTAAQDINMYGVYMKYIEKEIKKIEEESLVWKKELHITDDDYERISYVNL